MITYAKKERAKYWPVPAELMAQYKDGTHSNTNSYGGVQWLQNYKLHRDGDRPAYIGADSDLEWYQNDLVHRDNDKPAIIRPNGRLIWYQNGKIHRFSGPARIYPDGRLEWWVNGDNITDEVNIWLAGEKWCGTPLQIFEFQLRFT